ncbi:selenophosphate synthase [Sedimentibacter sp. zth1]|uniref:AIR synthase related protein n=1 Tax=Sedimentibacter sp. zth1 TaxID=2816908 RepID=UPI001A9229DF|nr:AIR synthase related protein [Sedimentibacter sp. zth1]QSX05418.1 selenophosphate synthase [Sedimentibacter sp. zth1]
MNIKQVRDLTLIDIDEERYIGISCDSCGGIGEKEHDTIKASSVIVGEQTAKVVLAELLSMGFQPLVLSDGLAVEMNDTGKNIIKGFNNTINLLKNTNVHLTGSTEENAKTVQTSIGTTGVGIIDKAKLKYKKTSKNDICVSIGLPLVGPDVIANPDKIMTITDYETLKNCDFTNEIVPVGSKGISYELDTLCQCNSLKFKYSDYISIDLNKSGGPSCSCIVSISEKNLDKLKALISINIEVLGKFY